MVLFPSVPNMDTVRYSETSTPIYHATWCHSQEFNAMNLHHHEFCHMLVMVVNVATEQNLQVDLCHVPLLRNPVHPTKSKKQISNARKYLLLGFRKRKVVQCMVQGNIQSLLRAAIETCSPAFLCLRSLALRHVSCLEFQL